VVTPENAFLTAKEFISCRVFQYFKVILLPGDGGAPYEELYGKAQPERDPFLTSAAYQRVGKIVIVVY